MKRLHPLAVSITSIALLIVTFALMAWLSGCVDLPLDVDEADVESRKELSIADVKQTLWALYGVTDDAIKFKPYYSHFHMYSWEEVLERFAEATWIKEFEYNWDHRGCPWLGDVLYVYLYGHMPGIPMFTVDIYPRNPMTLEAALNGHLYVGVLVEWAGKNRACMLLDPRYPPPDARAFVELDMSTMRIEQIRMAPGGG